MNKSYPSYNKEFKLCITYKKHIENFCIQIPMVKQDNIHIGISNGACAIFIKIHENILPPISRHSRQTA